VTTRNWSAPYIGIPWSAAGGDRNGANCWRLVVLVYKEVLGIELPAYANVAAPVSDAEKQEVSRYVTKEKGDALWTPVTGEVKPYDVILLQPMKEWHVGIAVDKHNMLHSFLNEHARVESFVRGHWKRWFEIPGAGAYRHANL
jgi:cell wall-associated NlpC family hydrolase